MSQDGAPRDTARILATYDDTVRRSLTPPVAGWIVEQAGPVLRTLAPLESPWGCCVQWSRLDDGDADRTIADQIAYFGGLGRRFEWKLYGHDTPADLGDRLTRAGLVAGPPETLVVGEVDAVLERCAGAGLPPGVRLRPFRGAHDFVVTARLQNAVWGGDHAWLARDLAAEHAADPRALSLYLAEADTAGRSEVVCAAWVRFRAGPFASLWGGSTLPEWRRRGIYRALVAVRAEEAASRGFRYLQVDASDNSGPILQRIGLRALTTTTPYVWTPPRTSV